MKGRITLEKMVAELKASPKYRIYKDEDSEWPCDICGRNTRNNMGVHNIIAYAFPASNVKDWEDDTMSEGIFLLGGTCLKRVEVALKEKNDAKK